MGGEDKMFSQLCGVPVLARTLTALDRAVLVDEIVVAVQPEKLEEVAALVSRTGIHKPIRVVEAVPTAPSRCCWQHWRQARTRSIWRSTTGRGH